MLLKAKYVIPVTSAYIEDGAVLVHDDAIEAVGSAAELEAAHPNEPIRDMGQAAILPGFIDVHTQIGYTAFRGLFDDVPYAEWRRRVLWRDPLLSFNDWVVSARLGALEAVASGITTIADVTARGGALVAADEIGMRARVYHQVMTTQASHAERIVQTGAETIAAWREQHPSSRLSFGIAPGPTYACHPQLFAEIARYATETNTPVALQLAASNEEEQFVRSGSSPFAIHASESENHVVSHALPPWLPTGVSPTKYVAQWGILDAPEVLAIHCVHVDEDDIELLRSKGVAIAHCPRSNAKLSMGSAPLLAFLESGLTVGIGTDSPAGVDTIDMIDEAKTGLLIARALAPNGQRTRLESRDMLRLMTIDAARALHMDDCIGSLEPGKKADIIAIDLHNSHQNPTTDPESAVIYTANQDNVKLTMVDGRILFDEFTHVSGVDRDRIVEEAGALRLRLNEDADDEQLREKLMERFDVDRQDSYNR